jgi:hypothetical protein
MNVILWQSVFVTLLKITLAAGNLTMFESVTPTKRAIFASGLFLCHNDF